MWSPIGPSAPATLEYEQKTYQSKSLQDIWFPLQEKPNLMSNASKLIQPCHLTLIQIYIYVGHNSRHHSLSYHVGKICNLGSSDGGEADLLSRSVKMKWKHFNMISLEIFVFGLGGSVVAVWQCGLTFNESIMVQLLKSLTFIPIVSLTATCKARPSSLIVAFVSRQCAATSGLWSRSSSVSSPTARSSRAPSAARLQPHR